MANKVHEKHMMQKKINRNEMNGSQYYLNALQIFLSSLENGVGQTIQRSEIPKDKEGMYQEEDAV